MVEAAENDYRTMLPQLTEMTRLVRAQLDGGFTDFQAVADVWHSLRTQQERPTAMLLAAIAVVQLAKVPQPPPLGDPRQQQLSRERQSGNPNEGVWRSAVNWRWWPGSRR
jgi:hypothetical protein